MKQSKFNIVAHHPENSNQAILHNTFSGRKFLVEGNAEVGFSLTDFLNKIDARQRLTDQECAFALQLKDKGLLLEDDVDEKSVFDQWYFDSMRKGDGALDITLVVSMACNLRCPYCFEKDELDNSQNMTMEVAQSFVNWVEKKIEGRVPPYINITFFGGEPLMNTKVVFWVGNTLKKLCELRGITYNSCIVSNGVLMTPKVAKGLRDCGVKVATITLDGDKCSHDETRITQNLKGSFDQIMSNLEQANLELEEGEQPLMFKIGGNFNEKSYSRFPILLDQLKNSTFKDYIESISFQPIHHNSITPPAEPSSHRGCSEACMSKPQVDNMFALRKEASSRQLPNQDLKNLRMCGYHEQDYLTVGVEGSLYTCVAFLNNPLFVLGNILDHVPRKHHVQKQEEWFASKPWDEDCYDCAFLPVCGGGCRMSLISKGMKWDAKQCEKEWYRTAYSETMDQVFSGIKA